MKLRLPLPLVHSILVCMASGNVTFATGSGTQTPAESQAPGLCSVVWKPTPNPADQNVSTPAIDLPDDAIAEEIDEIPDELIAEEVDDDAPALLDELDISPVKLPGEESGKLLSANVFYTTATPQDSGVYLVRVPDGNGGEKSIFLLGKGEEMDFNPDDDAWAFWDNPEGYHPAYFQQHYLHDGYSAVWVTSTHKIPYFYFPATAAAAAGATGGNSTTATTVATTSNNASAGAPAVAAPAPAFGGGGGGGAAAARSYSAARSLAAAIAQFNALNSSQNSSQGASQNSSLGASQSPSADEDSQKDDSGQDAPSLADSSSDSQDPSESDPSSSTGSDSTLADSTSTSSSDPALSGSEPDSLPVGSSSADSDLSASAAGSATASAIPAEAATAVSLFSAPAAAPMLCAAVNSATAETLTTSVAAPIALFASADDTIATFGAATSFGDTGSIEDGAITSMGKNVTQTVLNGATDATMTRNEDGTDVTYVVFNAQNSGAQYWSNDNITITSNLKIGKDDNAGEYGMWTTDGYSGYVVTLLGKVIGSGTIGFNNAATQVLKFTGDLSEFAGQFKLANTGARLLIASSVVGTAASKFTISNESAIAAFQGDNAITVNSSFSGIGKVAIGGNMDIRFTNTTDIGSLHFGAITLGSGNGLTSSTTARTSGTVTFTSGSIGAISGNAGSFVKEGTGKLTLTGANTATGTLTVNEGELVLQGANTSWTSITVGTNGTLVLDPAGSINYTSLTNNNLVLFGGTQTLTSMPTGVAGSGTFGVAAGAHITLGSGFSTDSAFSVNKGTLILSDGCTVSLNGMDNTLGTVQLLGTRTINGFNGGTLSAGNNANLTVGGTISANLSVVGNGAITFASDIAFSGNFVFDLTGATTSANARLVLGAGASAPTSLSIENCADLVTGTYKLVNTTAGNAETLKNAMGDLGFVDHHVLTLNAGDDGLQLSVVAIQNAAAGTLYKWTGTDTDFTAGSFVVAEYDNSDGTVYLSTGNVLSGWDTANGSGSQLGVTAGSVFGTDNDNLGSIIFAADYEGARSISSSATTLVFGGIVVEDGATGYSLQSSAASPTVTIGARTGASYSYIYEDFTLDAGSVTFRNTQDIFVDAGATFTISNAVTNTGTTTLSGSGTLAIGDLLTNEAGATFTVSGSANLTASNITLTGSGSTLTMTGGYINCTTPSTASGWLQLSKGATATISGGRLDVDRILIHNINYSSTETLTISGGVVNVYSTGDADGNSAAILVGHWPSGTGILNVSGTGVLNLLGGRLLVDLDSAGTFNLSGGEANLKTLSLNSAKTSTATVNLSGGRLNIGTGGIVYGNDHSSLNVTGNAKIGTLTDKSWTFAQGAAISTGTTLTIDTQVREAHDDGFSTSTAAGGAIDVTRALTGTGNLEKVGEGVLTLSAANTATGNLTVTGGDVVVAADNTKWGNITVGEAGTLALNDVTYVNFTKLTNNGKVMLSGTQTISSLPTITSGTGVLGVYKDAVITTSGDLGSAHLAVNAGTLILSAGTTNLNLDGLVNTAGGMLTVANEQSINGLTGGGVSVASGGTLTGTGAISTDLTLIGTADLRGATSFGGTAIIDLTGITAENNAALLLMSGSTDVSGLTINVRNFGGLQNGTYNLVSADSAATAQSIAALFTSLPTSSYINLSVTTSDDLVQLTVVNNTPVYAGTLYTYRGLASGTEISTGKFNLTEYVNGDASVAANAASGLYPNKLASYSGNILTEAQVSLRFDNEFEGDRALKYAFETLTFGALIVETGATGYSISGSGYSGHRSIQFMGLTGEGASQSIFRESFALDSQNSAITYTGNHEINISAGKTYTLTTGTASGSITGNVAITGGGTMVFENALNVTGSVDIKADTTLKLNGEFSSDSFSHITNDGHIVLGGNAELTGGSGYSGTGSISVAVGGQFTLIGNMSGVRVTANAGTLTLGSGVTEFDFSILQNTGTLDIASAQTLGTAVGGTVQVSGSDGSLTLTTGGSLTGTLVLDLADAASHKSSLYANLGSATVNSFSLINYSDLAADTYDLLTATDISSYLGTTLTNTAYKTFKLVNNNGTMQLTVTNIPKTITVSTNLTEDDQIPEDVPVIVGGSSNVTLTTGDNNETNTVTPYTFGDITVEGGSTLNVWLGNFAARTVLKTDKLVYGSRITLENSAKLITQDGSYYFSKPIVVEGNATITNNWDKGIVYSAIDGVDAETDKSRTLTFSPSVGSGNGYSQLITFGGAGDFGGKVVLNRTNHSYYVIDDSNAFQNALLNLNGAYVRVGLNKAEVNLRGLSGSGKLYIAADSAFYGDENRLTVAGTGVDADLSAATITITGNDTNSVYSGSFGTGITLHIAENASQTLSGTGVTLAAINAEGTLTLNGTTTVTGTVDVAADGIIEVNNALTANSIQNLGTLALSNVSYVDFTKLTNDGRVMLSGTQTISSLPTITSGSGVLGVYKNAVITTSGNMGGAGFGVNEGTLVLGAGTSNLNLAALDNSAGVIEVVSEQTIGGTITGGTVKVSGAEGHLTMEAGSELTGTLVLDLTDAESRLAAGTLYAAMGNATIGSFGLENYSNLAANTYDLLTADNLNTYTLFHPTATQYKSFSLSNNNGTLQLTVSNNDQLVYANTTWNVSTDQIPSDVAVSIADGVTVTIQSGGSAWSTGLADGTITSFSFGDITLEQNATLDIGRSGVAGQEINRDKKTVLTTDKPLVDSHITLKNGSTLRTVDGSYYFGKGITVAGNATIINQWGKGIAYGAIDGADPANPAADRDLTLTFSPNQGNGTQIITFAEEGSFGGKVVLNKRTGTHYVIDNSNALKNAEIAASGIELRFDVATANIRKLSGSGTLLANQSAYEGNYTGITTLNIAETSAFSGTIGAADTQTATVTVHMENNADLTLTSTTLNGNVTGAGVLTLQNSTVKGKISDIGSLTAIGTLTLDLTWYDRTTGNGVPRIVLGENSPLDISGLTSLAITNYSELGATKTYDIINAGSAENAMALALKVSGIATSGGKTFSVIAGNDGMVKLQVGLLELKTAPTIYTWAGNNSDMKQARFYVTANNNGDLTYVGGDDALEGNTGTGSQVGKTVTGVMSLAADASVLATVRFCNSIGTNYKHPTYDFARLVWGSIIVDSSAPGDYSVTKADDGNTHDIYLGTTDGKTVNSYIGQNFSMSADTFHLRGNHKILVDSGKKLTLTGNVEMSGTQTLHDDGTTAISGNLSLTAGAHLVLDDHATLTVGGGTSLAENSQVTIGTYASLTLGGSITSMATNATFTNNGTLTISNSAGFQLGQLTNNGLLRLGFDKTIATVISGGSLEVMSDATVTTGAVGVLQNVTSIAVVGTLDMTGGYTQGSVAQSIDVNGSGLLKLGGTVTLLKDGLISTHGENAHVNIATGTMFALDSLNGGEWRSLPSASLTRTITLVDTTSGGGLTNYAGLTGANFTVGGTALSAMVDVRSVEISEDGIVTVTYWRTSNSAEYNGGEYTDIQIQDGKAYTAVVKADTVVGKLHTDYAADSTTSYKPGSYSFSKLGEGTLTVLSTPSSQIDDINVVDGALQLGKAAADGQEAVTTALTIGGSRIISAGGTLQNVILDTATRSITNARDGIATLTDVQLKAGDSYANRVTFENVTFAGTSGLSGYVDLGDLTKNPLTVAAGGNLTIGTVSNPKLSLGIDRGVIRDPGVDAQGKESTYTCPIISLGTGATITNWNNDHVDLYYDGVLTSNALSVDPSNPGQVVVDLSKANELLWRGSTSTWSATGNSTAWSSGTLVWNGESIYDAEGLVKHTWNNDATRYLSLANVHFNTLTGANTKSDINLTQDMLVANFAIGERVDDSLYGATGSDKQVPADYYNMTAYSFSGGTMRVLREMYVRTAASLVFEGDFDIEAKSIHLYNSNASASVSFGGTVKADSLTIGQLGVDLDCYGVYTFSKAVTIGATGSTADNLYIHVDTNDDISMSVDQVNFLDTVTVNGNATLSGGGSKLFSKAVTITGDLTVSDCTQKPGLTVATRGQSIFTKKLTLTGNLILRNNGTAVLQGGSSVDNVKPTTAAASTIGGKVVMYDGTLMISQNFKQGLSNGERGFTFSLMGDGGVFDVACTAIISDSGNSGIYIESGDGQKHDFKITGMSRGLPIKKIQNVKNLTIEGGQADIQNLAANEYGIDGDLTTGALSILSINKSNIFTVGKAHNLNLQGTTTLGSGTTQTLGDRSTINLSLAKLLANGSGDSKAKFQAQGNLGITFTGASNLISANITAAEGHVITLSDVSDNKDSLLTLRGAITTSGDSGKVVLAPGSRVTLDGSGAVLSGSVEIQSSGVDEATNFMRSVLTVTAQGQITNAKITVNTGATLDVTAEEPVMLDTIVFQENATLSLAALTGTDLPDASLAALKITNSATRAGNLNLYIHDPLENMKYYALFSLVGDGDATLSDALLSAITLYDMDENLVDGSQYQLRLSDDKKTLFLAMLYGSHWTGHIEGDSDGSGTWSTTNTDKNWSGSDFKNGDTAIFRDLTNTTTGAVIDNATVTVEGNISTEGIYMEAATTQYNLVGNGTTLTGVTQDDTTTLPMVDKKGAATLTLSSFTDETFGDILVHEGTLALSGSTITYGNEVFVSEGNNAALQLTHSTLSHTETDGDVSQTYSVGSIGDGKATLAGVTLGATTIAGNGTAPGTITDTAITRYALTDVTIGGSSTGSNVTIDSGVTVASGATLTLSGTTMFASALQAEGEVHFSTGSVIDIGRLTPKIDTTVGESLAQRQHTYTVIKKGTGGSITKDEDFDSSNISLYGAMLNKYSSSKVTLGAANTGDGTVTITFNGVEVTNWDAAWNMPDLREPSLGNLVLGYDAADSSTFTHYATAGYLYSAIFADGTVSQVTEGTYSIVLSHHLKGTGDTYLDAGQTYATGNMAQVASGTPSGDIWVYDRGSRFSEIVAGYTSASTGATLTNSVTHLMFETPSDYDASKASTVMSHGTVIAGSKNVNTTGTSGTYVSVLDGTSITNLVAGNWNGTLEGVTHTFIHGGTVTHLYGGGYKSDTNGATSSVSGVEITVDGGTVTDLYAAGYKATVTGDVKVDMSGGTVTNLYHSGSTGSSVGGDVEITLTGGTLKTLKRAGTVGGNLLVTLYQEMNGGLEKSNHGLTTLQGGLVTDTRTSTLKLVGTEFNFLNTAISGFTAIDVGSAYVTVNLNTLSAEGEPDKMITVSGTGTLRLAGNESNYAPANFKFTLKSGVTLWIDHSRSNDAQSSNSAEYHVEAGATLDITGQPYLTSSSMGGKLFLNGHGVDGKGALYKSADSTHAGTSVTSLAALGVENKVESNASIGGTGEISFDRWEYAEGSLQLSPDAENKGNHTLTKQGTGEWKVINQRISGGTINIVEGTMYALYLTTGAQKNAAVSTTDLVVGSGGTFRSEFFNTAYTTFATQSLSGSGRVELEGCSLLLYNNEAVKDFYKEFLDSSEKFWNSEQFTYSVFSGTISGTGNLLVHGTEKACQYITGSASTFSGDTRLESGELYVMGTSTAAADGFTKNNSVVDCGALGKSTLKWDGGLLTLADGVRIFNSAHALSGAESSEGHVSYMTINVNGDISEKVPLVVEAEVRTITLDGKDDFVGHKVNTAGVKSLNVGGYYANGTEYTAGETIATDKGDLYVNKAAGSTVLATLLDDTHHYDTATYSGVISDGEGGKGVLVKRGLGTLVIDQYNSFTGGVLVEAGTLQVQGWGLLGGSSGGTVKQTAGTSLKLAYDGSYTAGGTECFFINSDMNIVGTGDERWVQDADDHHTAALISYVGKGSNADTEFTLAGTLSGSGNLLHNGIGTLYIDNWERNDQGVMTHVLRSEEMANDMNYYTGGTAVTRGTVYVRKDAGFGATANGRTANLEVSQDANVHFEDCLVVLAATNKSGYAGNNILGNIVVGAANGKISASGAKANATGTMDKLHSDMAVGNARLVMEGNGYWAEDTNLEKDGTLVFRNAEASNTDGIKTDGIIVNGATSNLAGKLRGTGSLVLTNAASSGHLNVAFANIRDDAAGFQGNIRLEGEEATLFINGGDFISGETAGVGNITITGRNLLADVGNSNVGITSDSTLWLNSQDGDGSAKIVAKSVVINENATLAVSAKTPDIRYSNDDTLSTAAYGETATAPATGGSSSSGEGETLQANYMSALRSAVSTNSISELFGAADDETMSYANATTKTITSFPVNANLDYTVTCDTTPAEYHDAHACNKSVGGTVELDDTGTLTLNAGSTYKADKANTSLANGDLVLKASEITKITLNLSTDTTDLDTYHQIVLFTNVGSLKLSLLRDDGDPLAGTYDTTNNTNEIIVAKANQFFGSSWAIDNSTLLVYDVNARVVYLDNVVPEPTSGALSVVALAALAARRRRKK